eukprot:1524738-Prymnesium_polylepis.1
MADSKARRGDQQAARPDGRLIVEVSSRHHLQSTIARPGGRQQGPTGQPASSKARRGDSKARRATAGPDGQQRR